MHPGTIQKVNKKVPEKKRHAVEEAVLEHCGAICAAGCLSALCRLGGHIAAQALGGFAHWQPVAIGGFVGILLPRLCRRYAPQPVQQRMRGPSFPRSKTIQFNQLSAFLQR
jgi:hypothetical protein